MKRSAHVVIIIMVFVVIGYLANQRLSVTTRASEPQSISAEGIDSLHITTSSPDVELRPGNSEQTNIVATLEGDQSKAAQGEYQLEMTPNQNVLNIQFKINNNALGMQWGDFQNLKLKVVIPPKQWKQLQVETTSGDVTVNHLTSDMLSVQSTSGDQKLQNLQITNTGSFQTTSGDIIAKQNTMAASNWEASSGDISTDQINGEHTTIQTNSGDIQYKQDQLSPSVTLKTSSGDVTAKLEGNTDALQLQFKGNSGTADVGIENMAYSFNSEHDVLGKTGSGEPQYLLNVETSSGDLEVN